MPTQTYEVTAPDGRTLEITGDHTPTEAELKTIFAKVPAKASAPEASAGPIARFTEGLVSANPITNGLDFVGNLLTSPKETANAVINASVDQANKAVDAYRQGRPGEALLRAGGAIPLVGPFIANNVDRARAGDVAGALGQLAWLATPAALKAGRAGLEAAGVPMELPSRAVVTSKLTPEEAAAVQFGESRGVPMDLATKTGSPTALAMQKRVANTIGGEGTAARTIEAQQQALARVGGDLASAGQPVSPEQAGANVTSRIRGVMAKLHQQANDAYAKLREIEQRAEPDVVPKQGVESSVSARQANESRLTGAVVPDQVRAELARIQQELEAFPYQKETWTDVGRGGNVDSGRSQRTAAHGGAPVYGDIEAHMPDTYAENSTTYAQKAHAIDVALKTGEYGDVAKAALEVAQKRLAGKYAGIEGVTRPRLPDSAAVVPGVGTENMPLAVDMRDAKAAVRPVYDRLAREAQLAPLMGGKATALRALDRLMNGPDYAPLSTADAALSDLKSLARADDPLLRTAGQGVAAKAVRELGDAIQMRAAGAGDEAVNALQAGRAATKAKYAAADVLDSLSDNPVRLYRQMTAPRDQGVAVLRQVQQLAPASMPELGRAKLQELLDTATERGRFDHADKLYAEWQKLGPATKKVLFPEPGQVDALDRFFLLAKRIAQNPNPSGTAHVNNVFNWMSSIGSYPLAKLLYTPEGVRALTGELSLGSLTDALPNGFKATVRGAGKVAAMGGRVLTEPALPLAAGQPDEK